MLNLSESRFNSIDQINPNEIKPRHEIINWTGDADLVFASEGETHQLHDGNIRDILAFDNSLVDASECRVGNNIYSDESVIFANVNCNYIYCLNSSLVVVQGHFMGAKVSNGSQLVCIFDFQLIDFSLHFDRNSEVLILYDPRKNFRSTESTIKSNLESDGVKFIRYDELQQPSNNYLQTIVDKFNINKNLCYNNFK